MKKTYTKPVVSFEDYALSANIAYNCGTVTNSAVDNVCAYNMGGIAVFLVGNNNCTTQVQQDDGQFGFCYDVPDGNHLFSS